MTVLVVTQFSTVDRLQQFLDELPVTSTCTVTAGDAPGEARVTIDGDPHYIRYAIDRGRAAHITRILEHHGPSTQEIPVTRKED